MQKKIKSFFVILKYLFSKRANWKVIISEVYNCNIGIYVELKQTHHIFNSNVGNYTYIARNSNIYNTTIGKFCSIGANFISGNGIHTIKGISTAPMFYSSIKRNGITMCENNKIEEFLPVTIGNDVFIGDNVIVLSGINIGHGAVIGAGTVVTKDIPPYAVAVGTPAKVIKFRFNPNQIESLLSIKWWDFPEQKLKNVERNFFNIDSFIKMYM